MVGGFDYIDDEVWFVWCGGFDCIVVGVCDGCVGFVQFIYQVFQVVIGLVY